MPRLRDQPMLAAIPDLHAEGIVKADVARVAQVALETIGKALRIIEAERSAAQANDRTA